MSPDLSRAHAEYGFITLALALERAYPDAPAIGTTRAPERERIRFRANPTLGFPAGEIAAISPDDAARFRDVYVNFLGLIGPSSPLPAHFTERVMFDEGGALPDFLDFFNHRLISLLFLIWKRYRHAFLYEPGAADPISEAVAALFGRFDRSQSLVDLAQPMLLSYAGLLAIGARSAPIVEDLMAAALHVPCRVEEFLETEFDIAPEDRFCLGRSGVELGATTVIGSTATMVSGHFRLHLGPLTYAQFMDLLPGGLRWRQMRELLQLVLNEPLAWSVVLVVPAEDAPLMVLGEALLGWTSICPAPDGTMLHVPLAAEADEGRTPG